MCSVAVRRVQSAASGLGLCLREQTMRPTRRGGGDELLLTGPLRLQMRRECIRGIYITGDHLTKAQGMAIASNLLFCKFISAQMLRQYARGTREGVDLTWERPERGVVYGTT